MRILRAVGLALGLLAVLPLLPGGPGELSGQVHQCSYCHDIHGGFTSSDVALNRESVVEDVCMTCHGDGGPGYLLGPDLVNDTVNSSIDFINGVHNGNLHTDATPNAPNSCFDCHDHEAEAQGNLYMIPRDFVVADTALKTVVFTSNTAQADFTGTNGICYVCHEDPATQTTGLNGHNGPDVCTTCHEHEGGFQGVGGGCTTCHSGGKGNHREVVSEFDRGSHHIQLGGAGADIPDADCQVCHNQEGHPREGTDFVVLINQNDSSQIAYDRGVTATSALTPFCISCHDTAGADVQPTPLVPFSDAITRPEIDETVWSGSSHKNSGNAECVDCHESHGSERQNLFTPGDVVTDSTTFFEEEEGFCFQCHTSGGAAGTDINAQFDPLTINWSASAWGISNIATFNDRHDVSHEASSVSGAKIECVNCHRPHADNASQKYNPDPDPANPAVTWTGQSTMDAFCIDCHDNTFPTGVLPHSGGAMVDISDSHVNNDSHGVPVSTGAQHNLFVLVEPTLGAGGTPDSIANPWTSPALMECVQCHRPHPKTAAEWPGAVHHDLFSLQDTVRHPDGRGLAYWQVEGSGMNTYTQEYWDYGLSEDDSKAVTEATAGGWYCNVCHDRRGMNGKNTCGSSGCHRHGGKL